MPSLDRRDDAVEKQAKHQQRRRREKDPGEHQRGEAPENCNRLVQPRCSDEVERLEEHRGGEPQGEQTAKRQRDAADDGAPLLRGERIIEGGAESAKHSQRSYPGATGLP